MAAGKEQLTATKRVASLALHLEINRKVLWVLPSQQISNPLGQLVVKLLQARAFELEAGQAARADVPNLGLGVPSCTHTYARRRFFHSAHVGDNCLFGYERSAGSASIVVRSSAAYDKCTLTWYLILHLAPIARLSSVAYS